MPETARGLLGIHREIIPPPSAKSEVRPVADVGKRDERIIERFALQSTARELLPGERVAECMRAIVPGRANVKIMHSPSVMRAHYKHLLVCSSVWNCPVCSAKISERRRVELTKAIEANAELVPALLTLTIEHTRGHSLKETLTALLTAYQKMTKGKSWDKFKTRFGLVGTIRALEITHGANGWHPHLHVAAFFKSKPDEEKLREFISPRWVAMVKKQDRFANAHGVEITFRKGQIADYVSKFGAQSQWNIEHELVKAASKVSRSAKGLSPFGLLRDYFEGNKASGRLFVEYAHALKGARQLVWSKELRSKLGITKEKSDEVIAKEIEQDAIVLAMLNRSQWRAVIGNDIRGELLRVANAGDVGRVWSFLAEFGIDRYATEKPVARPGLPKEVIALKA